MSIKRINLHKDDDNNGKIVKLPTTLMPIKQLGTAPSTVFQTTKDGDTGNSRPTMNGGYATPALPTSPTVSYNPNKTPSIDKQYIPSGGVTDALDGYNKHLSTKPAYGGFAKEDDLQTLLTEILAGKQFNYDINGDALYQQYKDKYIQQGKMAMEDAIGQASAMTGGYGNSYAQSVGQQMYQKEMQNLNDVIPELYQMAYDKHQAEKQELYDQYALLSNEKAMEYEKYRTEMNDWLAERDYLRNVYESDRSFDYNKQMDEQSYKYAKDRDDAADDIAREKALYDYQEALSENGYMLDKDGNIVPIQEEVVVDDSVSEEDIKNDLAAFGFSKENRTKVESYLNDLMATDPPTILPTEKKEYLEWWDEEVKANK